MSHTDTFDAMSYADILNAITHEVWAAPFDGGSDYLVTDPVQAPEVRVLVVAYDTEEAVEAAAGLIDPDSLTLEVAPL